MEEYKHQHDYRHKHQHEHRHKHQHKHGHHSHGVQTMDYYAFQSGLNDWNGGYKVLSSILILIWCIALDDIWVSLTVIVTVGMLNVIGNKVPLRRYLELLRIPIAFLVLGCIAIAFGFSKEPLGDYNISLHWFYLYLTKADIRKAAELFLKAMGAVSAMYFMSLSTPASELISALRKAHVPKLLVELMNMIYRFIFILTDVQGRMKRAAVSRLGYVDFRTSCGSFGKIAGNLFILSLKKADTYYDAMISRCYDGEIRFLEEEKKVTGIQVVGITAYLASLVLVWYMGK